MPALVSLVACVNLFGVFSNALDGFSPHLFESCSLFLIRIEEDLSHFASTRLPECSLTSYEFHLTSELDFIGVHSTFALFPSLI